MTFNAFPTMNEMKSSNTKITFVNAHTYKYESRKIFKLYKVNGQYVAMVKDEALFNDLLFVQRVQLSNESGAAYTYQLKDVLKVNGYIRFYFQ